MNGVLRKMKKSIVSDTQETRERLELNYVDDIMEEIKKAITPLLFEAEEYTGQFTGKTKKSGALLEVFASEKNKRIMMHYISKTVDSSIKISLENLRQEVNIGYYKLLTMPVAASEITSRKWIWYHDPFTNKRIKNSLVDFVNFLEKLSLARWPGAKIPVILKKGSDNVDLDYDEKKILYVDNTTGKTVITAFVSPGGEIMHITGKTAFVYTGDQTVPVNIQLNEFDNFSWAYNLATRIFNDRF